jgi:hypothetical protein
LSLSLSLSLLMSIMSTHDPVPSSSLMSLILAPQPTPPRAQGPASRSCFGYIGGGGAGAGGGRAQRACPRCCCSCGGGKTSSKMLVRAPKNGCPKCLLLHTQTHNPPRTTLLVPTLWPARRNKSQFESFLLVDSDIDVACAVHTCYSFQTQV